MCKYHLQDLQGEDLKGTFYKAELQKVTYSPDQTFEVEWELNCRGMVESKKCLSSGKVDLTSSTVGWLWIRSTTSQHECHILFHEGTSQKVTLPLELDMENKGCSLFDISSMVKPYIEPPIYLCADFVGNSIVVGSEHPTERHMQLPILRQINLKKTNDDNLVEIDPNYNRILWLLTSHSTVEEIQVYLSD